MFFENLQNLLSKYSYAENTGWDAFLAVGVFLASLIILKFFQLIIVARLRKLAEKTKTDIDDVFVDIFQGLKPSFYLIVSVYLGINYLNLPQVAEKVIYVLFLLVIVLAVVRGLDKLLDFIVQTYVSKKEDKHTVAMARSLKGISKVILWIVALLLILSNLGINITSLVASLGIGGLAVALALQNVLSDLFSSFSIYLDKPFQVGDYIAIGTESGTVEKIGMKTTRLRTLQGEELVVSNKELTSARVQNFRRMKHRRISFDLGLIYGLPAEKVAQVPSIMKEIISKEENAEFVRCHFKSYGASSIDFETVYNVKSRDYDQYMDVQQSINLAIYKRFEKEGLGFAYPTQTLFINKA